MTHSFGLLTDRRAELTRAIEGILADVRDGRLRRTSETQTIDFKEEAGRRSGSIVEPGQPTNPLAAAALADEVACMANSPEGGALILGVEDTSGRIIGTELDIDWLRQRIYSAIEVAPTIVAHHVEGQRVLVVYVAAAPEPVEDTHGRFRWRVGDSCKPVDRSEWWEHRRTMQNFDEMAQRSTSGIADVRSEALTVLRKQAEAADPTVRPDLTPEELLRMVGASDSANMLTLAGKLTLTSLPTVVIELTVFDVPGGQVLSRTVPDVGSSALEQFQRIERALAVVNYNTTVAERFTHRPIPRVPISALREALLNAMIHRDWTRSEPIEVRWFELDSTLIVRSPGGFPPSITAGNILSHRAARYPALADLFRAMGFVDKQGVGVDRMYQAMIVLGHRPPLIEQIAGPFVETTLIGGTPVLSVIELMRELIPEARTSDYRIAIVLYLLFHRPFITVDVVAEALQASTEAARVALQTAAQTTVKGTSLIVKYNEVWMLGHSARSILRQEPNSPFAPLQYLGTDKHQAQKTVSLWLQEIGDITTGDLMTLTGMSRGTAKSRLDELVEHGTLEQVGSGRSARYRG